MKRDDMNTKVNEAGRNELVVNNPSAPPKGQRDRNRGGRGGGGGAKQKVPTVTGGGDIGTNLTKEPLVNGSS